ncbi:MAG: hypothetical protein ACJ72D_20650 [Marmoricola sp.]
MPVVDLFLPEDLPIAADAELGSALAAAVDAVTSEAAAPCVVYVHRLPVYAVVSAEVEGLRTVRVQVSCDAGPWLDLAPGLGDVVRTYLRSFQAEAPTRIMITVHAVTESHAVTWPYQVPSIAV